MVRRLREFVCLSNFRRISTEVAISNHFNVEIVVKTVIWIWNEEEIQISGGMESIRGVRIGRVIELVGSRKREKSSA